MFCQHLYKHDLKGIGDPHHHRIDPGSDNTFPSSCSSQWVYEQLMPYQLKKRWMIRTADHVVGQSSLLRQASFSGFP